MKMKFLLFFLFSLLQFFSHAQTKFDITYNMGYGKKPSFSEIDFGESITLDKANELFKFLTDSSKIEFRYSYGSCEDRAHAMTLFLKSKGITTKKIWNFDPYYVSLFNSQSQLNVPDKSGLNDRIYWGFHVAPVVSVKNVNSGHEFMVIDPSISDNVISISEWLRLQNCSNSYYTYTDMEWFSFVTINGWNYNNQPIPQGFPTLLTGDFYQNQGLNFDAQWVEEGLAVNDMAMTIKREIIDSNSNINGEIKLAYKALLSNIDNLTNNLKNGQTFLNKKSDIKRFNEFQKDFELRKSYWKGKLDEIR